MKFSARMQLSVAILRTKREGLNLPSFCPFVQTMAQISQKAGCTLISFTNVFRQQLEDDRGNDFGYARCFFRGMWRAPSGVGVDQSVWIGIEERRRSS
jgi:hypothetical protein